MPVPLLAVLIPGLMASGAAVYAWLTPDRDGEWSDKVVFNDRMRTLHASIQNLNSAFAQCKGFMADATKLQAWRSYKTLWSQYYADVGKKEYFDPNSEQISLAKQYASQMVHWVETLKTFKECIQLAPPASPNLLTPNTASLPSWWLPVGIGAIISLILTKR